MTSYVLGIDVGGSSTKAALYRLDGFLVAADAVSYQPAQPRPGVAEYDPVELLAAAERSVAGVVAAAGVAPSEIVAVGCDAMVSGTVGLGADGKPTTAYTTTLDTRCNDDLVTMARHERSIRARVGSGTPLVAAKIAWYRRTQPEVFDRTMVFVTAGGLITGHFAGLGPDEAVIEPTVLWGVGLSDTSGLRWSEELTELLDIPVDVLPRIAGSTEVVGAVPAGVAAATGLRPGTPVIAGCGDQMAGFVGAGVLQGAALADSAGTYEVVGRRVDTFAPDAAGVFDVVPMPYGSGYAQQAVVAIGGGFTRQWFTSTVTPTQTDAELDALAATVDPGSDGLVFVPHLGGRGAPSVPWMRGAWLGLAWQHTPGHLARSLMEAMAYEIAAAIDVFGGERPDRIMGYGGGARSTVASQIKADVAGLPFVGLGDIAPASRAAALLAAIGVGELDSLDTAVEAASPIERITTPDPGSRSRYDDLRRDYAAAVALARQFRHTPDAAPAAADSRRRA